MVKTFDQAEEEQQKERREYDEENVSADEEYTQRSPYQFDGERLEEFVDQFPLIARAVPEDLKPGDVADETRANLNVERELLVNLEEQFGINLGDVLNELENISQIELEDLNQRQLLQLVVRILTLMARMKSIDISTQISQLQSLLSIATSVEPARLITVSGRNVIGDADTPETVVPQADKTDVPTRTVFIRADEDNEKTVYLGDDDVSPDEGFFLKPGEFFYLDIDFREDELYMSSEAEGDAVSLLGVF